MDKKSLRTLGLLTLTLLYAACGIELEHDLNVSGGIEVVHTVDTDQLYEFFLEDLCAGNQACADAEMRRFLDWLYATNEGEEDE